MTKSKIFCRLLCLGTALAAIITSVLFVSAPSPAFAAETQEPNIFKTSTITLTAHYILPGESSASASKTFENAQKIASTNYAMNYDFLSLSDLLAHAEQNKPTSESGEYSLKSYSVRIDFPENDYPEYVLDGNTFISDATGAALILYRPSNSWQMLSGEINENGLFSATGDNPMYPTPSMTVEYLVLSGNIGDVAPTIFSVHVGAKTELPENPDDPVTPDKPKDPVGDGEENPNPPEDPNKPENPNTPEDPNKPADTSKFDFKKFGQENKVFLGVAGGALLLLIIVLICTRRRK